jgi:hypothetical protein
MSSQHFPETGDFLLVHGCQGLSSARPPEDGVPEIIKISEGAIHINRFAPDAVQAGGGPEIP